MALVLSVQLLAFDVKMAGKQSMPAQGPWSGGAKMPKNKIDFHSINL